MSLVESADLIERVKATLRAQSEGAVCDMRAIKENIDGENSIHSVRSTSFAPTDRIPRHTSRKSALETKNDHLEKRSV